MTPIELENHFYDNRYRKEEGSFIDWCEVCGKNTKQTEIVGHTGLDSYSYCICSECGHKY